MSALEAMTVIGIAFLISISLAAFAVAASRSRIG